MYPCSMGLFTYTIQPDDTYWLLAQRYNTTVHKIVAANPGVDPYNLFVGQVICIPFVRRPIPVPGISKAAVDLKSVMRMLWEQHVAWTRMTIISIAANLPDENLVTKRLLRNASDMANTLMPFYGEEISSKFGSLMRDHLVIAAQLVKAAKAGDREAAASAEQRWFANADEIAVFLSSINPNWFKEALKAMLYEHLVMTKSEAVSRLSKDYASDISAYDKIEKQALSIADALTEGIVKQFPDIFI